MYGHNGEHCIIRTPVGTVVTDNETGEHLADLKEDGERVIILRGGKGGRGNMHFATSTNQAPRNAEKGTPAQERRLRLTLKLMADVGLVGFPNAGKSTLISRLSAAKPKIAAYPFTTLTPQLGMVRSDYARSFVLADIPGLIKGASDGAGLGHRFLRHIERVSVLAFVLSCGDEEGRDPIEDYEVLVQELAAYDQSLAEKPRTLILSKMDLPDAAEYESTVRDYAKARGLGFFAISSVTGRGLDALKWALQEQVELSRAGSSTTEPSDAHEACPPA